MNTLTAGRTDSAAYATADAGQSLADEQRLEAKARELANESFFSVQSVKTRNWLLDAQDGEGSMTTMLALESLVLAAIYKSPVDLSLAVDHLRACFVDACADDFLDAAAESLAADDADYAADFADAGAT